MCFAQLPERRRSTSAAPASDQLSVVISGGINGNELAGPDLIIQFVDIYLRLIEQKVAALPAHVLPERLVIDQFELTNGQVDNIYNCLTIYVVPLINPDGRSVCLNAISALGGGYHLGQDKSEGRLNANEVCLARNFDIAWNYTELFTPAAQKNLMVSNVKGNRDYHGSGAFSEVETRNMRWLLLKFDDSITMSFGLNGNMGSGSSIEYPWGFESIQTVDPQMCYKNPAYNLKRPGYQAGAKIGVPPPQGYAEYMPATSWTQGGFSHYAIAKAFQEGALKNKAPSYLDNYEVRQSAEDYRCTGALDDFVFSLDRDHMRGFTIEASDLQPSEQLFNHEANCVLAGLFQALLKIAEIVQSNGSAAGLERAANPNVCR